MGKKKSSSNVGAGRKKKVASAAAPLDRTERVRRGQEILQKVQSRIDVLEGTRYTGSNASEVRVTAKTRTKYENEGIGNYAEESGRDESDVRVDVQLAQLVKALTEADLEDAVTSGRLRLTKPLLADLIKLINSKSDGDALEGRLRELLAEQI